MDRQRGRENAETWEQTRDRLIEETSFYLTEAMRHPELAVRIPMIPADSGRFPPSLTWAFWGPVLADE